MQSSRENLTNMKEQISQFLLLTIGEKRCILNKKKNLTLSFSFHSNCRLWKWTVALKVREKTSQTMNKTMEYKAMSRVVYFSRGMWKKTEPKL